jgi:hypothetical protein
MSHKADDEYVLRTLAGEGGRLKFSLRGSTLR